MKVNGNDPVFIPAVSGNGDLAATESNIPIRLEIASRILLNWARLSDFEERHPKILAALEYADDLIEAHNETCGGE